MPTPLVAVLLLAVAGAPAGSLSIQGQVIDSVSRKPLSEASVVLMRAGAQPPFFEEYSDDEGRFSFTGLAPGEYTVFANHPRFTYGRLSRQTLELVDGESVPTVQLELPPPAVITGKVVDEIGEPVQWANVSALRHWYGSGLSRPHFGPAGMAQTDDRGMFRIYNVPPGKYVLAAQAGFRGGPSARYTYPRVFFPASTDLSRAETISVAPGALLRDISFRLARVRTSSVSGRVQLGPAAPATATAATPSPAPPSVYVHLEDRSPTAMGMGMNLGSGTQEGGAFTIRGVLPGSYYLMAGSEAGSAAIPIEVGEEPLTGVEVSLVRPMKIRGTVHGGPFAEGKLKVGLIRESAAGRTGGNAAVRPDGSFEIDQAMPLPCGVEVDGLPDGSYVSEVRQGDTPRPDLQIDGAASAPLHIFIATDSGSIRGTITDNSDKPADATVVLVPEGANRAVMRLYQWASTSTERAGRFRIATIPPGRYKLFAWSGIDDGAWLEPGFLEPWEERGVPITVAPGAKLAVSLRVLTTP